MQDKKQINVEIGARIKEEREKAGLTQEHFSELIGLGTKSVSAFERGTVGISFTTLKKICQVLSVSSDRILFGQRAQNENDLSDLVRRLERLSPKQYAITKEVVFKLLEAFSLDE